MDHVGIDVHAKYSELCVLSSKGKVVERRQIPTTETSMRRFFAKRKRSQLVMECGSMAAWLSRLLKSWGHQVVVVNPRRVRLIAESTLKSDAIDAEILARLSRFDGILLGSVYQRSKAAQLLRTRLRVRTSLVHSRTRLINSVRGTLRAHGYRMPGCETRRFVDRFVQLEIEDELRLALDPCLEMLVHLNQQIAKLKTELKGLSDSDELMVRLRTVPGVGPLVSLAYVAWMDRPDRFAQSRDVGACLGLRPRTRSSGGKTIQGRITREGDGEMRRLLVQAAHVALCSLKDTALKRWAENFVGRVGKKKAIVALARKIAIVLHRIWISGESFRAFPQAA